jgi:hypothetical protein
MEEEQAPIDTTLFRCHGLGKSTTPIPRPKKEVPEDE